MAKKSYERAFPRNKQYNHPLSFKKRWFKKKPETPSERAAREARVKAYLHSLGQDEHKEC